MRAVKGVALLAATMFVLTVAANADEFKMRAGENNPAAIGTIHANTDRNGNIAFELESKHLAPPDRLTPPHSVYVVWVQAAGKQPEAQGQLKVNAQDMAASFKTSVPYHNFDVFVTAEDSPTPESPSGTEVLRGSVQK